MSRKKIVGNDSLIWSRLNGPVGSEFYEVHPNGLSALASELDRGFRCRDANHVERAHLGEDEL